MSFDLYLGSVVNDTVVRVRVKHVTKVAGSIGWGQVGDRFGAEAMAVHGGWDVVDRPADKPTLRPAIPFRNGDILKNRHTQFLYYYQAGCAKRLSPADDDEYKYWVYLADGSPVVWDDYDVVYSDLSFAGSVDS